MSDPYIILGVPATATDEEIKNAYRDKARKFQEDKYESGPLADIAAKKMQELDNAYDEIISRKRSSSGYTEQGSGSAYQASSQQGYTYSRDNSYNQGSYSTPTYASIREKIKQNSLDEAQAMLDAVPSMSRIAEWYYLQGVIQQKKGYTNAAFENFEHAHNTDPTNAEYNNAYNSMNNNRAGGYRTPDNSGKQSDCGFCNMCQGLICADCCCECMGGDLIPCC